MEVALDNVDIQLPFCGREEDALVDLELRKTVAAKNIVNQSLKLQSDGLGHTFSTPFPNSSSKVPAIRVFLPAPDGP